MASTLFFRGAVMTAMLSACLSTDSYVYTAQKYDPTNDCVDGYKAVEIVNGSGASATCPAMCLMVGADLYVTTLCPPLPDIASAVDDDAGPCIAAKAAAATGGTCDAPVMGDGGDEAGDQDAADMDADGVDAAEGGKIVDAGDAG